MENIDTKQLFFLGLINFQNIFFWIWPIYYPYVSSLSLMEGNFIFNDNLYYSSMMFQVGFFIMNILLPWIFKRCGIPNTFLFSGLFQILSCFGLLLFDKLIIIIFFLTIFGMIHQATCTSSSVLIRELFKEKIKTAVSFVYMMNILGQAFWIKIMQLWLNNQNVLFKVIVIDDAKNLLLFKDNLGNDIRIFNYFLGIVSSLIVFIASFIEEPKQYSAQFSRWLSERFLTREEINDSLSEYNNNQQHKLSKFDDDSLSFVTEKSAKQFNETQTLFSNLYELQNMDEQFQDLVNEKDLITQKEELPQNIIELDKQEFKDMISQTQAILLISMTTLKNTCLYFYFYNIKKIGLIYIQNDSLVSNIILIGLLFQLISYLLAKKYWDKIDFFKFTSCVFIGNLIFEFSFLFFSDGILKYLFMVILHKILFGISHIIDTNILFIFYEGRQYNKMAKIFNLQQTVSLLIGFFGNAFLVENYNYYFLFKVFIFIEVCGIIILKVLEMHRKNIIEDN